MDLPEKTHSFHANETLRPPNSITDESNDFLEPSETLELRPARLPSRSMTCPSTKQELLKREFSQANSPQITRIHELSGVRFSVLGDGTSSRYANEPLWLRSMST